MEHKDGKNIFVSVSSVSNIFCPKCSYYFQQSSSQGELVFILSVYAFNAVDLSPLYTRNKDPLFLSTPRFAMRVIVVP